MLLRCEYKEGSVIDTYHNGYLPTYLPKLLFVAVHPFLAYGTILPRAGVICDPRVQHFWHVLVEGLRDTSKVEV